jgi:hypothetical protein
MDIGTAIIASYSANLVLYVTITVYVEVKNYIIEKYYS